jgi:hypothetical protein
MYEEKQDAAVSNNNGKLLLQMLTRNFVLKLKGQTQYITLMKRHPNPRDFYFHLLN